MTTARAFDTTIDHSQCTHEQIAAEMDTSFSAGDGADVPHYLRLVTLLGTPKAGAGMVSHHEWDETQFDAYQTLAEAGDDLEWVDTLMALADHTAVDDDFFADEPYIEAEQRLAVLADHDEACSYTLKANADEIQQHLLAIVRGDDVSTFERTECYRLADEPWAYQVRQAMADDAKGTTYADVATAIQQRRDALAERASTVYTSGADGATPTITMTASDGSGTYERPLSPGEIADLESRGKLPTGWQLGHLDAPRVSAADAAQRLLAAWEQLGDAYATARDLLPQQQRDRFEAYTDQIFELGSRMLGMQSIGEWMHELASTLNGETDD